MSFENVQEIIGRAITDAQYRELLFSDPDQALKGYELDADELEAIKGMEQQRFDSVFGEVEERVSRAGFGVIDVETMKCFECFPKSWK